MTEGMIPHDEHHRALEQVAEESYRCQTGDYSGVHIHHHYHHMHGGEDEHDGFWNSKLLTRAAMGLAIGAAVIILAPHVAAMIGVAPEAVAAASNMAHITGGSGLAGGIAGALSHIPLIGGALAEGGVWNAVASGTIGIGGALLANYVENNEDGTKHIKWSKVLRVAALATSAFVAAPALLPAFAMGLIFFDALLPAISPILKPLISSLGTAASFDPTGGGLNGAAVLAPHVLTCGSTIGSIFGITHHHTKHMKETEHSHNEMVVSRPSFTERLQQQTPGTTMARA